MFSQLLPLSPSQHCGHGWKRHNHYCFAAADARAPLVIAEIPSALPFYPLAFARRQGGGYQLVVLQGLHDGENLYLNVGGLWQVGYTPSIYRGYPFVAAGVAGDSTRTVFCFDRASGLYREAPNPALGEERFFDDEGKLQPLPQQILEFLRKTTENRELTNRAVDALEAAGLLEPWELPLENPTPKRPLQQGLYRIKEAALDSLDGQALENLRNANALAVAYAQIFSIPRLGVLRHLFDRPALQLDTQTLSLLNTLFGEDQDDLICFS